MPNAKNITTMSLNLLLFYTLIAYSLLHFTAFFSNPTPCMTPALPMAWQQTLQPFVLPFWWILGSCYYMDPWMQDVFYFLVECASPRPEDDPLWGSTNYKNSWLYISVIIDLEVWWFWFYEMVLHCTSPVVQKSTLIFNTRFSSVMYR